MRKHLKYIASIFTVATLSQGCTSLQTSALPMTDDGACYLYNENGKETLTITYKDNGETPTLIADGVPLEATPEAIQYGALQEDTRVTQGSFTDVHGATQTVQTHPDGTCTFTLHDEEKVTVPLLRHSMI